MTTTCERLCGWWARAVLPKRLPNATDASAIAVIRIRFIGWAFRGETQGKLAAATPARSTYAKNRRKRPKAVWSEGFTCERNRSRRIDFFLETDLNLISPRAQLDDTSDGRP